MEYIFSVSTFKAKLSNFVNKTILQRVTIFCPSHTSIPSVANIPTY